MHGAIPHVFTRQGSLSPTGLDALSNSFVQFGLSGGQNDSVGNQGITPKPQVGDRCFAVIDDVEGNKHAWTELDFTDIDNPVPMNGGRRGTIETDSSSDSSSSDATEGSDDQPAYDFNGNSHAAGTIVYIERVRVDGWGIICCAGSDTSSDSPFTFTIDCEAGTIVIGDEEPQTPTTDGTTGGGTTPNPNPKKGGGSVAITNTTGDPGIP